MSDKPHSPEAFPTMTDGGYAVGGMTLRQWYAGQAIAGLVVRNARRGIWDSGGLAEDAFQIADALLAYEGLSK